MVRDPERIDKIQASGPREIEVKTKVCVLNGHSARTGFTTYIILEIMPRVSIVINNNAFVLINNLMTEMRDKVI